MRQEIKLKRRDVVVQWSLAEPKSTIQHPRMGAGGFFFDINDKGNMVPVLPEKEGRQRYLDIKVFVDGLCVRDLNPLLIRFTDILQEAHRG